MPFWSFDKKRSLISQKIASAFGRLFSLKQTSARRLPSEPPQIAERQREECAIAVLRSALEAFQVRADAEWLHQKLASAEGVNLDEVEEVAKELGLMAEQHLIPPALVLGEEFNDWLPLLVLVNTEQCRTHAILLWQQEEDFFRVMDPRLGHIHLSREFLRESLFIHVMSSPLGSWGEWLLSEDFQQRLQRQLRRLQLAPNTITDLLTSAGRSGWEGLNRLDAAARYSLLQTGQERSLEGLRELYDTPALIPQDCWLLQPESDEEQALVQGGVVIRFWR